MSAALTIPPSVLQHAVRDWLKSGAADDVRLYGSTEAGKLLQMRGKDVKSLAARHKLGGNLGGARWRISLTEVRKLIALRAPQCNTLHYTQNKRRPAPIVVEREVMVPD